jgi:hypothetical protein
MSEIPAAPTKFVDLPAGRAYQMYPDMPPASIISILFRGVDMTALTNRRNKVLRVLVLSGARSIVLGENFFAFRVFGLSDLGLSVSFVGGNMNTAQIRHSTGEIVYEDDDDDAVYQHVVCFDTIAELIAEINKMVK